MRKLVVKLCWGRFGVRRFQNEVNALFEEGWYPTEMHVTRHGLFRVLCYANLVQKQAINIECCKAESNG